MSKRNIHHEKIYITVEPTAKHDRLLIGRLACYIAIVSFLLLNKYLSVEVPDALYWSFGCSAAGLEVGQLIGLFKRKV